MTSCRLQQTLSKAERINSRSQIEQIFGGGHSHALTAFPLRMVYRLFTATEKQPDVQILISVPKKQLRHAVDRNRIKRLLRQSYRTNKHIVTSAMQNRTGETLSVAFIWMDSKLYSQQEVTEVVVNLLTRLSERLCRQ